MNLADILKDSNYKLSQFTAAEIDRLEQTITVKESKSGEVPYVICLARQKAIRLTPEEAIRQLYLYVLTERLDYPLSRIQVEYGVNFGREVKRADIVVMDKDRPTTVYMLVELKKPKLKDGKDQLRSYCNATGAPIAVWTNGDQISYYQRKDPNYFEDIPDLPNVNQTLADILQIKFTLEDLITHDKLVKENKSLKTLIEEMEDEVLANAGVDVFEELFKLIKLIDYSWQTSESSKDLYQQAEDLLLSELGLKDWQPTEKSFAIKSFSESFLSSDRLDAEYYQPKYEQAEKAIKDCGFLCQNLGSFIEKIQNGFDYREYTEEGTPYIRVGDVKNGQINFDSAVKIPITMADVNKPVDLQVGDILFTRKGSFGNSAVVTELEIDGIISSEIILVRLKSAYKQEILPEYVSLFLNSKFGYLQVERRVHGVAYYSIAQPDLANLLIPILPKSQQQKIVDKVKLSFSLKLKSKQLLEIAKIGVERAIETDEATATDWINQQLADLGVTL
jgi:hypothetical protein